MYSKGCANMRKSSNALQTLVLLKNACAVCGVISGSQTLCEPLSLSHGISRNSRLLALKMNVLAKAEPLLL